MKKTFDCECFFTITRSDRRWLLQVWEPAEPTEDSPLPFLWKVKFPFDVIAEAIAFQREHYWQAQPQIEMPETPTGNLAA